VKGRSAWPRPVNEVVPVAPPVVDVAVAEIQKDKSSCRSEDTRLSCQTLAARQVVAASEAQRDGRRIADLEGHLDGEALAVLGCRAS
jgi:hypothetical protein